jgi:hypothetical protein
MEGFWNWQACRKFIQQAIEHYKYAPGWFTDWLDDLYIRLDEQCNSITLDEIQTLGMLSPDGNSWEPENYAVNRIYKMFDRLGRNTTGIAGY